MNGTNRNNNSNAAALLQLPCSSKRIAYIELFRPRHNLLVSSSSLHHGRTTLSKRGNNHPNNDEDDDDNDNNNYKNNNDDDGMEALPTKMKSTTGTTIHHRLPIFQKTHLVFLIFYIYQIYWLIHTMGVPYQQFIDKAEREGFEVLEGTAQMRAELNYALSDLNDPHRSTSTSSNNQWFRWLDMDIEELAAQKKREREQSVLDSLPKSMRVPRRYMPTFASMFTTGVGLVFHVLLILLQVWNVKFNVWMNYVPVFVRTDSRGVKQNKEEEEEEEEEEDDEEESGWDVPKEWIELDEEYNPLLQSIPHGITSTISKEDGQGGMEKGKEENKDISSPSSIFSPEAILARIEYNQYQSTSRTTFHLPTHALITPTKKSESSVLVPLLYLPTLGMTLEYHRRRYYFCRRSRTWMKIRCNTTMPLTFFRTWNGLSNIRQYMVASIQFGPNKFNVRQPSFMDMYQSQLLSPFTIFQLFCVILWMLDDYWQYSLFTLVMILGFEATVVYARLKSLSALRGMGNAPRKVMVYRCGNWSRVWTTELLPGDILSLTRAHKKGKNNKDADVDDASTMTRGRNNSHIKKEEGEEEGDVIPADLLILRGSTVVNEASLTGESIPQMKEGIHELVEGEILDIKTRHKTHVLYAGTKMLQCKGVKTVEEEEESSDEEEMNDNDKEGKEGSASTSQLSPSAATMTSSSPGKASHHAQVYGDNIPNPPDGGCITFVLRTGFSSAQGKLVRMIEGSQEKVKGHEKDTALLLLLLFFFAVASSSYVLYHGLQNENRSQYELLLHCILIITSVIPPELPMQMALAVNNSLMTLMKLQIFCTEPYRVPMAGKLDVCLFDKTGTLTTDELVPVGVMGADTVSSTSDLILAQTSVKTKVHPPGKDDPESQLLTPMSKLSNHASALVLIGCHSLVLIDGETTGDPLESAALKAMRWEVAKKSGHVVPSPGTEKKQAGAPLCIHGLSSSPSSEIKILSRHHFSSKLQRMSCVVKDIANNKHYSVVKGSPEMIGQLLEVKPLGYDKAAKFLSRRGYRVISLAYKTLSNPSDVEIAKDTRAVCEERLTFAGFVAFTCRVRKDTKLILSRLQEGGMGVTMVTGDALLTAIHVAKEVNICDSENSDNHGPLNMVVETNSELKRFLESKRALNRTNDLVRTRKPKKLRPILILEKDDSGRMYWLSYEDDSVGSPFVANELPTLAKRFELAVTGANLAAAYEYDPDTKLNLSHFKVFARMSPDAKETIIEHLHSVGKLCLMCGDGANDVGALKQADVGVALLSGFGDVNVDKGEDSNKKKESSETNGDIVTTSQNITVLSPQDLHAARVGPIWQLKARLVALGVDLKKYPEIVEREDLITLYEIKGREKARQNRVRQLAKTKQMESKQKQREVMLEKQRKMQLRVEELQQQGVQWAQFKALQEFMAAEKAEVQKKKSQISSVEGSAAAMVGQIEDLELDELPMVKIGDASVAAPFTSKMPSIRSCVDIVRQGRCTLVTSIQMYQILALNCLISAYSLSVLYLDGVKYGDTQMTAMGMLGSISYMSVSRAKPLEKLSKVKPLTSIFHPSLFLSLLGQFAIHLITMMWATQSAKEYLDDTHTVDLDGEFQPGLLNSVVFLVSNVQQVTVFVVNLQGRPFMTGLTENRPLLWSLLATFLLTFMFASESVPGLNKYFQLVPFPDDAFRNFIIGLLAGDVILCLLFDRVMKLLFCPQILRASVEGTTRKDVWGFLRTVMMIGLLMKVFLGNDEQWEELLAEEEAAARLLAEQTMNTTITSTTNVTDGSVVSTTGNESLLEKLFTVVNTGEDEFMSDEF